MGNREGIAGRAIAVRIAVRAVRAPADCSLSGAAVSLLRHRGRACAVPLHGFFRHRTW